MRTIHAEQNWAHNVTYSTSDIRKPSTVEQLQEVVASSKRVRALGSRHSFNDIADSIGSLVSLAELEGDVVIDAQARTVTFPGGMRYGDLAAELESAGWALANLASLPHISVAGAVSTGTHGSGDGNQTLSAAVTALDLVAADGTLHTLAEGDTDFPGSAVGLGALGIISRLSLRIEPTFRMRQDLYEGLSWSRLLNSFDDITSAGYSVSINPDWLNGGACRIRVKSRADDAPDSIAGARRVALDTNLPVGATPRDGSPGAWHDRLPHFLLEFTPSYGEELQSEYLLDRKHAPAALEALRAIGKQLAPVLHSTEIRTIARDELWLSPAFARESVGIHFTWRLEPGAVRRLLPLVEQAVAPFAARPHWGKLFAMGSPELRTLFPRMADFLELRERMDPQHRFGNAFTARLLDDE